MSSIPISYTPESTFVQAPLLAHSSFESAVLAKRGVTWPGAGRQDVSVIPEHWHFNGPPFSSEAALLRSLTGICAHWLCRQCRGAAGLLGGELISYGGDKWAPGHHASQKPVDRQDMRSESEQGQSGGTTRRLGSTNCGVIAQSATLNTLLADLRPLLGRSQIWTAVEGRSRGWLHV